jgi:hypothetical protein
MRLNYCLIISILILVIALLVFGKKSDYDTEEVETDEKIDETRCGGYELEKIRERKPYKIVSSFTTSPLRIFKTKNTIYSLKEQTYKLDRMLLNIPKKFARSNQSYVIPDFIKKDKRIKINVMDRDYGPATKLVGAILSIPKNEDVWIVVHDDDQLYLQDTINQYTNYIDGNDGNKKFCYSISGFILSKDNEVVVPYENLTRIDVLEGFLTFCVHRSLFEDDFIPYINNALTNKEAFQSDDLIISNYIAMKGAEIYLIYNDMVNKSIWWSSNCNLDYGMESDALHQIAKEGEEQDPLGGHYKKYLRVIDWLKDQDMYYLN